MPSLPSSSMADQVFQIGEVARRVGLSITTIRHWDDTGLAPPSARSTGGFRLYTTADIDRLLFIKRFRPLGFGIEDTRSVLAILDGFVDTPSEVTGPGADRLRAYVAVANERCEALRTELADAEAFIAELERHLSEPAAPAKEPGRR